MSHMDEHEIKLYLAERFSQYDCDALAEAYDVVVEYKDDGETFILHSRFGWPPETCEQIRDFIVERLDG